MIIASKTNTKRKNKRIGNYEKKGNKSEIDEFRKEEFSELFTYKITFIRDYFKL